MNSSLRCLRGPWRVAYRECHGLHLLLEVQSELKERVSDARAVVNETDLCDVLELLGDDIELGLLVLDFFQEIVSSPC